MPWNAELDLAKRAAAAASDFLREAFVKDKRVLAEVGRDIKLQADRDAEDIILDILSDSGFGVLAEESGASGDMTRDAPVWVVDPLDGTMNYKHGIPICCVSIALSVADTPVLGVISDFNRGETFTGIPGVGAWLNDDPMRVSDTDDPARAVLTTGFPTNLTLDPDTMSKFVDRAKRFKKVRMLGSAALMMAYVASGRCDAYAEDEIMYWDIAAGAALIQAAGGWVHAEAGGADPWARRIRCAGREALWRA